MTETKSDFTEAEIETLRLMRKWRHNEGRLTDEELDRILAFYADGVERFSKLGPDYARQTGDFFKDRTKIEAIKYRRSVGLSDE